MLLGELLIKKKLITQKQLDEALQEQKQSKELLGVLLVRKKIVPEEKLLKVLSEHLHVQCRKLDLKDIDWNVTTRFSTLLVMEYECLPFKEDANVITAAITYPFSSKSILRAEEEAGKGREVRLVLISYNDMQEALRVYGEKMGKKFKRILDT